MYIRHVMLAAFMAASHAMTAMIAQRSADTIDYGVTGTAEELWNAVSNNDIERARALLSKHNVNKTYITQISSLSVYETLLSRAISQSNIEMMKLLLTTGARDTHIQKIHYNSDAIYSAVHLAVLQNNNTMLESLIAYDADIEAQDHNKNRAIHMAARKNNIDATLCLIENGCDVNAVNQYREKPIDVATHEQTVSTLAEYGAHSANTICPPEKKKSKITHSDVELDTNTAHHARIYLANGRYHDAYRLMARVCDTKVCMENLLHAWRLSLAKQNQIATLRKQLRHGKVSPGQQQEEIEHLNDLAHKSKKIVQSLHPRTWRSASKKAVMYKKQNQGHISSHLEQTIQQAAQDWHDNVLSPLEQQSLTDISIVVHDPSQEI